MPWPYGTRIDSSVLITIRNGGMAQSDKSSSRPFLGVMFECCRQYARVYINSAGDAYLGRCPRCSKSVRFVVGEGGSSSRMWRVS